MELDIGMIITLVLGGVTTFFGGAYAIFKKKFKKFVTLLKEAVDVVNTVETALGDDKLTSEEIAQIKKEAVEAKAAWKALLQKE